MHQLLFIALLTATTFCAAENVVFTTDFNTGTAGDYLKKAQNGVKLSIISGGNKCLEISESVSWVELKPIVVKSGKRYKLSFRGRIESEDSIEKNDRAHIVTLQGLGRNTGAYQISFLGDNNKKVRVSGYNLGGFIITKEWYDYVNEFYVPAGAKNMRIRFLTGKHHIFLDDINLTEVNKSDTINCNPDFRYGELNYCGWRPGRGGRFYQRPDGKTVFKAGYAGRSPRFPLNDASAYRIFANGKGQTSKGWITLLYYDNAGKRLGQRFLLRPTPQGSNIDLVPPPGTKSGDIVLYSVILEKIIVTRIGGKTKI